MHRARREIEVSAEMLMRDPRPQLNSQDNQNTWNSFRADVWPAYGKLSPDGDKVGNKLDAFRKDMEALCRPIVDKEFGRPRRSTGAVSVLSRLRGRLSLKRLWPDSKGDTKEKGQ